MIRAYRSEWLKLRRPAVLMGGGGAICVFAILAIVLGFRELSRGREGMSVALLSRSDGFMHVMGHASSFLGIIAVGIAAFAFASEFSLGTLRNLLVRQPNRLVLLTGKLAAVWSLIALAVVIAYVIAFPVALSTAPHYGVGTGLWTGSEGIRSLFAAMGNMVLATLGYALLGALLGLLLRSPAPAIVVGILYALPVEALLTGAFSSLRNVLFGDQLSIIAQGGTAEVSYTSALLVAGLWMLGGAVVGAAVFRVRDVVV